MGSGVVGEERAGAQMRELLTADDLQLPAACNLLDVQPCAREARGTRSIALALSEQSGEFELWAINVSAAVRASDLKAAHGGRNTQWPEPTKLHASAEMKTSAKAAKAQQIHLQLSKGGARLQIEAHTVQDAFALLSPLDTSTSSASESGADLALALLASARAASQYEQLPSAHPAHAPNPSARVHVLGGGVAFSVSVVSPSESALSQFSKAGAEALGNDGETERLWTLCWHAGLLRGVAPRRSGATNAGAWHEAAGADVLDHLEHAAQAQKTRAAFDPFAVLRAACAGDRQQTLAVARLQLCELALRHCATAAAVSEAATADGAALSAMLLGSTVRDLVRDWALAAADSQVTAASAAVAAVAAMHDSAHSTGGGSGAGTDAIALLLELAAVRANGLCAVLAAIVTADESSPAALSSTEALDALQALAANFHAMRSAAFLVSHGLLQTVGSGSGSLSFPLQVGAAFETFARADWADAGSELGSAAAFLKLFANAHTKGAEALCYTLSRTVPETWTLRQGSGSLLRLIEATHPAHGVGVGRARALVLRALAAADEGEWLKASGISPPPSALKMQNADALYPRNSKMQNCGGVK